MRAARDEAEQRVEVDQVVCTAVMVIDWDEWWTSRGGGTYLVFWFIWVGDGAGAERGTVGCGVVWCGYAKCRVECSVVWFGRRCG